MMGRRRQSSGGYRAGDWYLICDISGRKIRASESVQQWDGLRVHWTEASPRHPQDYVRGIADRQVVPFSRPEATDTFLTDNQVTSESL